MSYLYNSLKQMRLKANVRNSNKLVWVCFCGVSLHLGWLFGQLGFNKRSGDHTTEEYWAGIAFDELSVCWLIATWCLVSV